MVYFLPREGDLLVPSTRPRVALLASMILHLASLIPDRLKDHERSHRVLS